VIEWSAALLLLSATGGTPASAISPIQFAQVVIRQQIIIRVPAQMRKVAPAAPSLIDWKEGKGPDCVPAKEILGATLLSENSVDLIMRDNRRVRARLENSCPALDYYYGFYISPNADGKICADRDAIRSRMGGQCGIERFRTLTAQAKN
jgi:hypothetical protein